MPWYALGYAWAVRDVESPVGSAPYSFTYRFNYKFNYKNVSGPQKVRWVGTEVPP